MLSSSFQHLARTAARSTFTHSHSHFALTNSARSMSSSSSSSHHQANSNPSQGGNGSKMMAFLAAVGLGYSAYSFSNQKSSVSTPSISLATDSFPALLAPKMVHAAEISSSADLSSISLDDKTQAAVSGAGKKYKKKRGRRELPNPGKFAKNGQTLQHLLSNQASPGLSAQLQLYAYPMDGPNPDKQMVVIPGFRTTQQGPVGSLVVETLLGRSQKLTGYSDTQGNTTGSWKFKFENGLSIRPYFQYNEQSGFLPMIDAHFHGKEFVFAVTNQAGQDTVIAHNQSITPNLTAAAELHLAGLLPFLNGGFRYTNPADQSEFTFTKRDSLVSAGYSSVIHTHPHLLASIGAPPCSTMAGIEAKYNIDKKNSEMLFGIKYNKSTYSYHFVASTAPYIAASFDTEIGQNLKWGGCCQFNYDGSGDSAFGFTLMGVF